MLVVMKAQATQEEIQAVCEHIEQLGFRAHPLPGAQRTAIGITGNQGEVDRGNLEALSGVAEVIRVSKPYKLASRDVKEEDTVIQFAGIGNHPDATIGGRNLAIFAGPCSVESREQAFAIAEAVAASGAQFFRGGAYKPRTSPYAWRRCASWPRSASASGCVSSPRPSTARRWIWWLSGPMWCRSARATCRTFPC
jgi:3-deoxy-7-phosphoheptulonate synthase